MKSNKGNNVFVAKIIEKIAESIRTGKDLNGQPISNQKIAHLLRKIAETVEKS